MKICRAENCRNEGIHSFPKDLTRRLLWEKALRIPNFKATKFSQLCRKHFKEDDFYDHSLVSMYAVKDPSNRYLKKTAVPSLFHYNKYQDPEDHSPKFQTQYNHIPPRPECSVKPEKVDENNIHENTNKVEKEIATTICRTCLMETAIIPLTKYDDGCTLEVMLAIIAGVRMEPGLPNAICSSCAEDLLKAIAFRRRARLSDNTLRQKTRWRLDGDSADIFSSLKMKQEPPPCDSFERASPDQTFELVETVIVYKKLEPNTGYTDNPSKIVTKNNNITGILSKEGRVNELRPPTYSINKNVPQINPKLNETVKSEPVFIDVTKKEIKSLKPVKFQDVLKALGPDKLPPHLKKILQNKHNKLKMFDSKQELPDTKLLTPGVENMNTCPNAEITDKQTIANELNVANNMDELVHLPMCPYPNCSRVYQTNSHLEIHITKCHPISKPIRLYVCTKCGKKCHSKSLALKHMRTHKNASNTEKPTEPLPKEFHHTTSITEKPMEPARKNYQCEECGQLFLGQISLVTHVRSKHTGERPYKCDVCNKSFVSERHVKNHRDIHLPNRKRPYICAHCDKGFVTKYHLEVHMQCHSDVRRFKCKECGKMFGLKFNLVAHEKNVHGLYKISVQ